MQNNDSSPSILDTFTCEEVCEERHSFAPGKKLFSRFELWPTSIIYAPAVLYWIILALRYRSLTVPLCSNPSFQLGGMVSERKSDIFNCARAIASHYIAPWTSITKTNTLQLSTVLARMKTSHLQFPVIAKPEIGCRGAGVRVINTISDLNNYLQCFPNESDFLLQQKVPWEREAGIFYFRYPGQKKGKIFSMGFKYPTYVFGNGKDSLRTLIKNHARAKHFKQIYYERHKFYLKEVLPPRHAFRLGFARSHSCGTIFKEARQYITPVLEEQIDYISKDIEGFYYGRFDIRFKSIDLLQQGKAFKVVEINGAGSEATHIWDPESSLQEIQKTLCKQFKIMFRIGSLNRKKGVQAPGLIKLIRGWCKEKQFMQQYPPTD